MGYAALFYDEEYKEQTKKYLNNDFMPLLTLGYFDVNITQVTLIA